MEFHDKIQELRKNRNMTQEELASALYVSRTAISKWESGRGYPSIESLKEISHYFNVSIDDLLSSEKLLTLAQKENKSNIQNICDYMFGLVDISSILLILLPLYPNTINELIYSVNLFEYKETTTFNIMMYWLLYSLLIIFGVIKILFKNNKVITYCSMILSILLVLFLALTRIPYAIFISFIFFVIKCILLFKSLKV